MKRLLVAVLLAVAVVAIVLVVQNRQVKAPDQPPIEGSERPALESLPADVRQWVENSVRIFAGQSRTEGDQTYLLITLGEQTEGGRAIRITEIISSGDKLVVEVDADQPSPGQPVIQVFNYPFDLVVVPRVELPIEFRERDNDPSYIPGVIGTDTVEPIVAENRWIKVFAPERDARVSGEMKVRGLANVFEGTVNLRLVRGNSVLSEGFATGAMGDWGYFETSVPLGGIAPGPAELMVFTYSAKDGSIQEPFTIAIVIE